MKYDHGLYLTLIVAVVAIVGIFVMFGGMPSFSNYMSGYAIKTAEADIEFQEMASEENYYVLSSRIVGTGFEECVDSNENGLDPHMDSSVMTSDNPEEWFNDKCLSNAGIVLDYKCILTSSGYSVKEYTVKCDYGCQSPFCNMQ